MPKVNYASAEKKTNIGSVRPGTLVRCGGDTVYMVLEKQHDPRPTSGFHSRMVSLVSGTTYRKPPSSRVTVLPVGADVVLTQVADNG